MTVHKRHKLCCHCGKEFKEIKKDSNSQWKGRKYCNYFCMNRAKDHKSTPAKQRFLSRAIKRGNQCWGWRGYLSKYGRARMRNDVNKLVMATHISWELVNGPVPLGKLILHTCDNPTCTNPDHLFLGTQTDNMRDMLSKGRGGHLRGQDSKVSKLTDNEVKKIKSDLRAGQTAFAISKKLGMSPSAIYSIRDGRTWGHIA